MKSDVIHVTNEGAGFDEALAQAEAVARFRQIEGKGALHLRLLTEEMLGMMRAMTGERDADFWIDDADGTIDLHLAVKMPMTAETREKLLSVTTDGTNSAAKGVTGKLRDLVERFLEPENDRIPDDLFTGMDYAYSGGDFGTLSVAAAGLWSMNRYRTAAEEGRTPREDWDELEKSVVARLADDVKIGIAGRNVEMIISKKF
ncbi:MAG: hypothetical protein IKZ41_04805 [Clostridia bacterium]|nr:hypothetical protein [Clostridia bacterium]MBR5365661.1 hypothetical protein [Clostridia bacterium]